MPGSRSPGAPPRARSQARLQRPAPERGARIACRHCRRRLRVVTAGHLRSAHGYAAAGAVSAYKRRFGLLRVSSPATVELKRRVNRARTRRGLPPWTRAQVVDAIQRRAARGRGLAPSQVPSRLYQAARRLAGGWSRALELAGLDPARLMLGRRWNAERVLRAIRRLGAQGRPLTAKRVRCYDRSLFGASIVHLGSWGRALRAAGLDPLRHREPTRWSLAGARAWIRDRLARGRPILVRDVPRGLRNRVERDAGLRWPAFVESTGRRYPGFRRTSWTDDRVLEALRRRRREGLSLALRTVAAEPGTLSRQAVKRFGGWEAALRAAGLALPRRSAPAAARARQAHRRRRRVPGKRGW